MTGIVEEVWFCYSCLNPFVKREATSSDVLDVFGEVVETKNKSEIHATDIYCNRCGSHLVAHAYLTTLKTDELKQVSKFIYELYEKYDGQTESHWEIPFLTLLLHAHGKIPLEIYYVANGHHDTVLISPAESQARLEKFVKEHAHFRDTILEIIESYEKIFGRHILLQTLKSFLF